MKTFLIKTACDDSDNYWIINADTAKEAVTILRNDSDFELDESILSCDFIDTLEKGIVYLESRLLT